MCIRDRANDEAIGLLEGVGVTMYDIDTDELKAAYEAKKLSLIHIYSLPNHCICRKNCSAVCFALRPVFECGILCLLWKNAGAVCRPCLLYTSRCV